MLWLFFPLVFAAPFGDLNFDSFYQIYGTGISQTYCAFYAQPFASRYFVLLPPSASLSSSFYLERKKTLVHSLLRGTTYQLEYSLNNTGTHLLRLWLYPYLLYVYSINKYMIYKQKKT